MTPVLLVLLVWAVFIVGRLTAPRRVVTMEEKVAKLREKSYARWYAAQIAKDEEARTWFVRPRFDYTPHKAVNLLPYPQVER